MTFLTVLRPPPPTSSPNPFPQMKLLPTLALGILLAVLIYFLADGPGLFDILNNY